MDCYTLIAMVDWYPGDGALRYEVVATSASGHNVTCENSTANCELKGMLCGHSYSVSVRAIGETCSSIAHMTGRLSTGNQIFVQTLICSNNFFSALSFLCDLKKQVSKILVIDAVLFLYKHHKSVSIEEFLMHIFTFSAFIFILHMLV